MDFYFASNLPRENFSVFLLKYNQEQQTWKVIGKKFAFYWFNEKKEDIQIQFLNSSNKTFVKLDILKSSIIFDDENCSSKLIDNENNIIYGTAFEQYDNYNIFKEQFYKLQAIQKKIDQAKQIQFTQNQVKEYIQFFIDKQELDVFEILPLTLLLKNNTQFILQLKEWLLTQLDDVDLDIMIKKKLLYLICQTFQFFSKNFLKSILLNEEKFDFIKNLIYKFHEIFQLQDHDQCNYEFFQKNCFQLIEQRILQKVRQDRIQYAIRLRYLLQNLFKHFMSEKFLQIYQKMVDKNQHQIFCQVVKNDQNVKIIVTQIEQKKYQRFDFLVELLHSFDKHPFHFDRAISFLNQYLFMNFLRRILQKVEFINNQNEMIIKIRCKYFGIYDKFRRLLEFIALFIQRNPVCFVTQIFPVNQRLEHYRSLKCIISLYFQNNYQNLELTTLQAINNILNNILRLTEDQQDYFNLVGDILLELFQEYKFLKFKQQTLQILDFFIYKNHQIILEKVLNDTLIQEHLVDTIEHSKVKLKKILASKILCYLIHNQKLKFNDANIEMKLRRFMMTQNYKKFSMANLQMIKLKNVLQDTQME